MPSFTERLVYGFATWGLNYVIARYAFHLPYAGGFTYFVSGIETEAYFIARRVGARK